MSKEKPTARSCVRCGICLGACPVYRVSRIETESPRGRLELMRALEEHDLTSSPPLPASLSNCLFCLRCQRGCPAGVAFDRILFQVMASLSPEGGMCDETAPFKRSLRPVSGLPFDADERWIGEELKGTPSTVVFPGCLEGTEERERMRAGLAKKGIDAVITPEGMCCGLPYLLRGDRMGAEGVVKRNMKAFGRLHATVIATPCPFCIETFRRYYPLLYAGGIDMTFKHCADLIPVRKSVPGALKSKKVAYHTPCLLDTKIARHHQKIIEKWTGSAYVTLPEQVCCGHGFGFSPRCAGLSTEICRANLLMMADRGVQVLITDCPSCTVQWKEGVRREVLDIEIMPLWNLVLYAD
ncbi:MAG: (Fe-S)-binding protein [bacterium]